MKYRHAFRVAAPLEAVAAFHRDPRALKWLSPPPIVMRFHNMEPMAEGSITEFTMWAGLLPIRWRARHSGVDPLRGFVDEQVSGPYRRWVHRHVFSRLDEHTTEVKDEIDASLRPHVLWGPVGLTMWVSLPLLFAYRSRQTRRRVAEFHISKGHQKRPQHGAGL